MMRKGFSESWINLVMSSVRGGKVGININGDIGPYFKTYRGLRHGDPLSPLLFNLAADALAEIITLAQEKGLVKGVISHLVPGGVPILQYADGTVIMLECEDEGFLLYCFEWMSGLKINYHKSEVYVLGADNEEANRIANILIVIWLISYDVLGNYGGGQACWHEGC